MEQVLVALHTTYFFLLSKCWMVLPFEMVSPWTLRFFEVRFIPFLSKISFIEFSFVFTNKIFNLRINIFVIFFTNMKKKKKKNSQAWVNSNNFGVLFLILISLFAGVSLVTFISLFKNQCMPHLYKKNVHNLKNLLFVVLPETHWLRSASLFLYNKLVGDATYHS